MKWYVWAAIMLAWSVQPVMAQDGGDRKVDLAEEAAKKAAEAAEAAAEEPAEPAEPAEPTPAFPTFKQRISYASGMSVGQQHRRSIADRSVMPELPVVAQHTLSLDSGVVRTIGMSVGQRIKDDGFEVEPKLVAEAIADALGEGEKKMTMEQMAAAFQELNDQLQAHAEAQAKAAEEARLAAAGENKTKGEAFLAENAKKEGVKVTQSGLQYKVLEAGDGATPKATDVVKTHYRGTLIDGTEFDSSYERGEPVEFPVNGVIQGWVEALQLMKVGGKWRLYIPPDLAYGERGAGRLIGPNQVLIFDIELLDIVEE